MRPAIGEFALIERLCAGLPRNSATILGPGDDSAILAPMRRPVLFTVDSLVENVHFRLRWGTPELLGERALTVNLSDIAAMGGVPTACVVNLGIRPGIGRKTLEKVYVGLKRAARSAGVAVAGGNVTRAGRLTITIAMLGRLGRAPLRRDAARVGDEILVTGTLGDAAAGLRILDGRLKAAGQAREFLVGRCLRPTARLYAGQRLAALGKPPAAIDISDGLLQDLGHILKRSGVGAEVDPAEIPLSRAYREAVGDDPALALNGGEDYELLFCLPPRDAQSGLARRLKVPVRRIGRIVRGRGIRLIGGARPRDGGWDQLRSR